MQRGAVSPVSSELSMLDQLCVVADGAPPPPSPVALPLAAPTDAPPLTPTPTAGQAYRGAEADACRQLHKAGLPCASVDGAATSRLDTRT